MRIKALFLQFFLIFSAFFCYAEPLVPHGIELSDAVQMLCKKNQIPCETQNIVANSKNSFPYNILVYFPSHQPENIDGENFKNTLLIVFNQEDVFKNPDIISSLLERLSSEQRNFNLKILFSFGDKQIVKKNNAVLGSQSFIQTIDEPTNHACLLVSFDDEKNLIVTNSNGYIAPTWFVKNVFSAFNKSNLLHTFDKNYISCFHNFKLSNDEIQKSFFESGIPCIKTQFNNNTQSELISDTLIQIIKNYDYTNTYQDDHHSIMYSFGSKQIWFTEDIIIKTILIIVFITLLIIFTYGLINESFKKSAWARIKKIWHYPFVLYFLAILIILVSRNFIITLKTTFLFPISIYISIIFTLTISFVSISFAFLSAIKHEHEFNRKSIDYLSMITSFVNLFLFCLYDISLFPIFAFGFFLSLIATFLKRNYSHFIILILNQIPLLPFVLQLLNNIDSFYLQQSLSNSVAIIFALLLIILPQYLTCFRIFTSFNYYWFKRKSKDSNINYYNLICLASFILVSVFLLSLVLPKSFRKVTHKNDETNITYLETDTPSAKIETNKRYVFGDAIRTVIIQSEKEIKQCELKISGKNICPVLFSDYDFIIENTSEATFIIPYEPPKTMEFSYGEEDMNVKIIFTAIYSDMTKEEIEVEIINKS